MGDRLGHIKINSKNYRVDLTTYRGRDVNDFSPRASTPGGGIVFSQMDAYQVVAQEDWAHGFGFDWFEDVAGYSLTEGAIDTREQKQVTLFQTPTYYAIGSLSLYGVLATGNATYPYIAYGRPTTAGDSGLYRSDANVTTWTALAAFNDLTVQHAWYSGTYVFVTVFGDNRMKKSTDVTTWTDAGNTECCVNFNKIVVHDGYVFVSKSASGTHAATHPDPDATHTYKSNQVYYGSAEDLSDLEGAQEDDPDKIVVGPIGEMVQNMISYNGDLFFFRRDAVYKMNKDRSGAVRVLDYTDQVADGNFICVSNYNGSLYFNVSGSFYQWNGVRVQDVTPKPMSVVTGALPKRFSVFRGSVVVGKYLYVLASTRTTADGTFLLVYDGVGWSMLYNLYDATYHVPPAKGLSYIPALEGLFFGSYTAAAAKRLYRFVLQNDYGATWNYPTGTGNHLYTSKIDAGFRLITKSCPSILLQMDVLSSGTTTNTSIRVYYRTDVNTTWTAWGTNDGTTNIVSAPSLVMLNDPLGAGTGNTTLEFKWIQFKIDFRSTLATHTPVLQKFGVKLLLRPGTTYGYSFTIIAAEDVEYAGAYTDDRSSYTIMQNLRTARASKAPIVFEDPFGDTHYVYITSIQELAIEEVVGDIGPKANIEQQIMVNLMEITNA